MAEVGLVKFKRVTYNLQVRTNPPKYAEVDHESTKDGECRIHNVRNALSGLRRCTVAAISTDAAESAAAAQTPPQTPQSPPQTQGGAVSEEEKKALEKINTATDPNLKLQAAAEYLKKFGKSPTRQRVATYLADEVSRVEDPVQRVALSQTFMTTFAQPEEADLVKPYLIDGLIRGKKLDEGFAEGAKYLEKHPEDVVLRTQLAIVGANEVQKQNAKYVPVSKQYAKQSIELMEADKKPPLMEPAAWPPYRTQWLPKLYQAQGVMAYVSNEKPDAKVNLEKAASLEPGDPVNAMLLGTVANDEYQELAKKYNAEKNEAVLKQAQAKMDEVIDWYARAIAGAEGKPGYEPMTKELMPNLEQYYSYRHNGSTNGLKELIEKYKKK